MYNYQVDEEEIQKKLKQNNITSENDLQDAFKEIDKANGFDFGEVGGYQKEEKEFDRMEIPEKSQEQIESEAKDFYQNEIETKKDELEQKYNKLEQNLNEDKNDTLNSLEKNQEKLDKNYKQNSKNSLYDSIKQGIARSSIENKKQEYYKNEHERASKELLEQTEANVTKIENSLNILKEEKEKAMKDFDLAYAIKVSEKIKKLEEEYAKEKEKAIKYNEKIAEEERKFNEEQQRKSEEYDKNVLKKLEEHEKNLNELGVLKVYGEDVINQKQALTLEYLNTLSREDAMNLCLSSLLIKNLGAKRTYDLYRLMQKRD